MHSFVRRGRPEFVASLCRPVRSAGWARRIIPTTRMTRSYRRLLVHHSHQAECICSMRRPIVFRPHANIAHFVFSLVIEAERLESGLRRTFVEPASRKHAASSLYSHHRSAGTLVLDHIDFKAGVLKMILVGLVD